MGLDMYFEGTFSTRAFSERDPNNYKRENVEIDLDFEATLESIGFENAPIEFTNWKDTKKTLYNKINKIKQL